MVGGLDLEGIDGSGILLEGTAEFGRPVEWNGWLQIIANST